MSKLKGAIIGFGNIAEKGHWPTYAVSNEVEIVAVVDSSPQRQLAAQKLKADLRGYVTFEHMLENEKLDFVDICTPPASHGKLAQTSIQRGLHVLCEKPLSLQSGEYQLLLKNVIKYDKTVFTVHNWKYAPIFQKAFEILRQGRIGPVWHVEVFTLRDTYCKGTPQGASSAAGKASEDWRQNRGIAGGGILIDHGWHAFYLLMNLVGAEPQKILAKMLLPPDDNNALEEAVQALVQFPEADAYVHLTWRAKMRRNNVSIQGQTGTLLINDDRLLLTTFAGKREEFSFPSALSAGSHHADWFKLLFPDFLEEIRNPELRGKNFKEAGWCVALTCGAYESNRRGFQEVSVQFPGRLTPEPALVS